VLDPMSLESTSCARSVFGTASAVDVERIVELLSMWKALQLTGVTLDSGPVRRCWAAVCHGRSRCTVTRTLDGDVLGHDAGGAYM